MSLSQKNLALQSGLTAAEYDHLLHSLNREPSLAEIGIASAMWSEHCSYRSSKKHLRRVFSSGKQVLEGPGENAGAVDIGDGLAVIFKMESHNHPSFLEPYQGAATGVGGIMRDIFTMGARPIAFLNALRFGAATHPKTPFLLDGVVRGIGGYGNCVGVPTVGGEVDFHPSYNGNILVNAMCAGVVQQDKIFRSRLEEGCALLYVGARTGRDGLGGAVMASASFDGDEASRTSVQIGDPFMQKLLLECCLEMMAHDGVIGLQDMGAAGLTSSSVEMAEKSGCGIVLDLDQLPVREDNMNAYEIMLSESQERMLIAIHPEAFDSIQAICDKWDVAAKVIGMATRDKKLLIRHKGKTEAELPIGLLVHDNLELSRPIEKPIKPKVKHFTPSTRPVLEILCQLLTTPELCSKRWVAEQYDQSVMGDTLLASGGDSALIRIHGKQSALALVSECTARYCAASPLEGAKQAVAECFRNICAVGAKPLAITDCLNFASPEDPKIMGQFSDSIDGMSEAARVLDMPVVSGNVSFYNETDGKAIMPTPTIGAVGLMADYRRAVSFRLPTENLLLLLVGKAPETFGGMSLYQKYILADESLCAPPAVELAQELKVGNFVRAQIMGGKVLAAHDIGSGGLAPALAEMAIASQQGITLENTPTHPFLFDEAQARFIVACEPSYEDTITAAAKQATVPLLRLGLSGGKHFACAGESVTLEKLEEAYEFFIPNLMGDA